MARNATAVKLKCGCAYTDEPAEWTLICAEHAAEGHALRERWARERLDVVIHGRAPDILVPAKPAIPICAVCGEPGCPDHGL